MNNLRVHVSRETNSFVLELIKYAEKVGIELNNDDATLMILYLDQILEENKKINLTAITDYNAASILHLIDSLTYLHIVPDNINGNFIDIGTGGGFPGVPFGIYTKKTGILVDSVKKKTSAVNRILQLLGIKNIQAIHSRVEELKITGSQLVLTRALSSLPSIVELAAPLLDFDGILAVSKGKIKKEEIEDGVKAGKICGMAIDELLKVDLPNNLGSRTLIRFVKINNPKINLPRKLGKAQKNPLS